MRQHWSCIILHDFLKKYGRLKHLNDLSFTMFSALLERKNLLMLERS